MKRPLPILALTAVFLAGCSHAISRAPNHGDGPFDFRKARCKSSPLWDGAEDLVSVRYLGAGGVAIGWQGETILTAPFFSNYSLARVLCGRIRPDKQAIREGLAGVRLEKVRAVLVGHAHYDHLGDLPELVPDLPGDVKILTNDSGVKLLGGLFPGRFESLQGSFGKWRPIPGEDGRPRFRVLAVRSEHAPHFLHFHWGGGEVRKDWTGQWTLPVRRLRGGTSLSFVLDLLDPESGRTRFRLYLQDAASGVSQGLPPALVAADGHPVDLAVFCLPSYTLVRDAPGWLLDRIRPRHVLVTHYEDFFQARTKDLRFVTLLTRRKTDRYLEQIENDLRRCRVETRGPLGTVCGASAPEWTMPLPGEALTFEAAR